MAAVGTGRTVGSRLSPEAAQCVDWIEREQDSLERVEFGNNKRSVEDALKVIRHKVKVVDDYKGQVNRVTRKINNEHDKAAIETAYESLKFLSAKRLQCLENLSQIAGLEELFGSLTYELADKATTLVTSYDKEAIKVPEKDGERIPHSSQTCILAVRNNWNWITKLVKCTDVHVKHIAEYHQYFNDLAEYDHWLPTELRKLDQLLLRDGLKGNREDASRLLSELKMALTIFLTWQGKTDSIFDRAKKVVPVHLRSRQLDHPRPVTSLCNYKTDDIEVQEGEELVLLDNKMQQSWLVRSLRSKEAYIPSVICLIPPPDTEAVSAALRFRLKLLGTWTCHVKRIGKTLIYFLLLIFRDWNKQEEEVLKALPDEQKAKLIQMCDVIEDSLAKYWSGYPDFKTLQARFSRMRTLLRSKGDPRYRNSEMGRALIVQVGIVEELLRRYKDLWSYWETYKIMVESCRHSEMMLICSKWEELKFIDMMELLKHWHTGFGDDKDLMHLSEHGMEEMIEERTAELTEMANGTNLEGEIYNVERALETAEAEHISSAEQEEKKTFIITGVIDPSTGAEISLDEAVKKRIINQQEGTYVNSETHSTVPIPVAMNAGWIQVEYTTTKKSEERRRDIGLITIKTQRESRPYTVKRVKDIQSDRMLTVDEAMAEGLIDFKKNEYRNRLENSIITIADALDSGLLEVEIDGDMPIAEPEIDVKTYAIYAVVDQVSRKSVAFGEAVRRGLIDPETGSYHDTLRHEQVYVGDAIKRGFIKASVVTDPNSLDIDPKNREVIEKMQRKLSAMKAVDAFKKSVGRDSEFDDLSPLGDIEPTGESIFDRYLLAIIDGADFLSPEEDQLIYLRARIDEATAMDDLDDNPDGAEPRPDRNLSANNPDGNTDGESPGTLQFDSTCSIFQGFFLKMSEFIATETGENFDVESSGYDVTPVVRDADQTTGVERNLGDSGNCRDDGTRKKDVGDDDDDGGGDGLFIVSTTPRQRSAEKLDASKREFEVIGTEIKRREGFNEDTILGGDRSTDGIRNKAEANYTEISETGNDYTSVSRQRGDSESEPTTRVGNEKQDWTGMVQVDKGGSSTDKDPNVSGGITGVLTQMERDSYDASGLCAEDGGVRITLTSGMEEDEVKMRTTGDTEDYRERFGDECGECGVDYRDNADRQMAPSTVMLEGLKGSRIMESILRGFLNGEDTEDGSRGKASEPGRSELEGDSAESAFISTREDASTERSQYEAETDVVRQEDATGEKGTAENVNNEADFFVTEQESHNTTEVKFDISLGEIGSSSLAMNQEVLLTGSQTNQEDGVKPTSRSCENRIQNLEDDIVSSDGLMIDQTGGDIVESEGRAIQSDGFDTTTGRHEEKGNRSNVENISAEEQVARSEFMAARSQKMEVSMMCRKVVAVAERSCTGDGTEKVKDIMEDRASAAAGIQLAKEAGMEEEEVDENLCTSTETDAASEKCLPCVGAEEIRISGLAGRRTPPGEKKTTSKIASESRDKAWMASKFERDSGSREEGKFSSTLFVSRRGTKKPKSRMLFRSSRMACADQDNAGKLRRYRYKLILEAEIDFDIGSPPTLWYNVCSGCLPFWLLLFLLLLSSSLLYVYLEEYGCLFRNNHKHSMDLSLSYYNGPPPY